MQIKSITKSDIIKAENLLRIIAKGQFELSGQEAMAFTDACVWLGKLYDSMKEDIQKQQQPMIVKEVKSPVKEATPSVKPKALKGPKSKK